MPKRKHRPTKRPPSHKKRRTRKTTEIFYRPFNTLEGKHYLIQNNKKKSLTSLQMRNYLEKWIPLFCNLGLCQPAVHLLDYYNKILEIRKRKQEPASENTKLDIAKVVVDACKSTPYEGYAYNPRYVYVTEEDPNYSTENFAAFPTGIRLKALKTDLSGSTWQIGPASKPQQYAMVVRILRRVFGGTIPDLGIATSNKRKVIDTPQLVIKKPRYDQLFPSVSPFAKIRQLGQQVFDIRQDYQHPRVDNSMDKVDQILSLLLKVQSEISLLNVTQQVLPTINLTKDNQVTQTCTTGQCTVNDGTNQIQQVLQNVPTLVNGSYDTEIADLRAELKMLKQTLAQLSVSITTGGGQAIGIPGVPVVPVIDAAKKTLDDYAFFGKLLFDPTLAISQELQNEKPAYVNLEEKRKNSQKDPTNKQAKQLFENQLNLIYEQLVKDIEKLPPDVAKVQLEDLKKNPDKQKDLEEAYNNLKKLYYESANPLDETDEWKAASERRLQLKPLKTLFPGKDPESTDPEFAKKIDTIQKIFKGDIITLDPSGLSLQEIQAVLFLLIKADFSPKNSQEKYDKTVQFVEALDKAKLNPPKIDIKKWARAAEKRFSPPVAKPKEVKKSNALKEFVPKSKRLPPEIPNLAVDITDNSVIQDLTQTVAASSIAPGKVPPPPGKVPPPPGKAPPPPGKAPPPGKVAAKAAPKIVTIKDIADEIAKGVKLKATRKT